eukprot:2661872-Pyramimonas_sp.AAC.1
MAMARVVPTPRRPSRPSPQGSPGAIVSAARRQEQPRQWSISARQQHESDVGRSLICGAEAGWSA